MLPLSEITVKPHASALYLRLVLLLYLLSWMLVIHSSLYLGVKLVISGLLVWRSIIDWRNPNPCFFVQELTYKNKKWFLLTSEQSVFSYQELEIVFHNTLFLLLKLTSTNKKRLIVLFTDQLSKEAFHRLCFKVKTLSSTL